MKAKTAKHYKADSEKLRSEKTDMVDTCHYVYSVTMKQVN